MSDTCHYNVFNSIVRKTCSQDSSDHVWYLQLALRQMKIAELLKVTGWDIALQPDRGLSSTQEASSFFLLCSWENKDLISFSDASRVTLYRADQTGSLTQRQHRESAQYSK